jgi:hypothetical protein
MMRFEYKRALGHAWYLHKLFWGYTFFYSSFAMIHHIFGKDYEGDRR